MSTRRETEEEVVCFVENFSPFIGLKKFCGGKTKGEKKEVVRTGKKTIQQLQRIRNIAAKGTCLLYRKGWQLPG